MGEILYFWILPLYPKSKNPKNSKIIPHYIKQKTLDLNI